MATSSNLPGPAKHIDHIAKAKITPSCQPKSQTPSALTLAFQDFKQKLPAAILASNQQVRVQCEAEASQQILELTRLHQERIAGLQVKPSASKGTQTYGDPKPSLSISETGQSNPNATEQVVGLDIHQSPLISCQDEPFEEHTLPNTPETPPSTPPKQQNHCTYAQVTKPLYNISTRDLTQHIHTSESGLQLWSPPTTPEKALASELSSPQDSFDGTSSTISPQTSSRTSTSVHSSTEEPFNRDGFAETIRAATINNAFEPRLTIKSVLRGPPLLSLLPLSPKARPDQLASLEALLHNLAVTPWPAISMRPGPCAQCVALGMPCSRKWPCCQRCSLRLRMAKDKASRQGREDEFYAAAECCIVQACVYEHQAPDWRILRLVSHLWGNDDGSDQRTSSLVNVPIRLGLQHCEVHVADANAADHWDGIVKAYIKLAGRQLAAAERRNWVFPSAH